MDVHDSRLQPLCDVLCGLEGTYVDFRQNPRHLDSRKWIVPFIVMPLDGGWRNLSTIAYAIRNNADVRIAVRYDIGNDDALLFAITGNGNTSAARVSELIDAEHEEATHSE